MKRWCAYHRMRIAQPERHKQTNLPCISLMMLTVCRVFVRPAQALKDRWFVVETDLATQVVEVSIFPKDDSSERLLAAISGEVIKVDRN